MDEPSPLDLAGMASAQRAIDEQAQQKKQVEIDDFKFVMEDKRGRRFVWRLLEKCGVFRTSFTGDNETFFKEGQRNVGLAILAAVHEACPEKYAVMLKEQREYVRRKSSSGR